MSDLVTFLRNACRPAQIYLVLVLVNFLFAFAGKFKKDSPWLRAFVAFFVATVLVGLAFTWVANYLCLQGWEPIAWLLVLLPLTTLFINLQKLVM